MLPNYRDRIRKRQALIAARAADPPLTPDDLTIYCSGPAMPSGQEGFYVETTIPPGVTHAQWRNRNRRIAR